MPLEEEKLRSKKQKKKKKEKVVGILPTLLHYLHIVLGPPGQLGHVKKTRI